MRPAHGWVIVVLGCISLSACSSDTGADGPREQICGTWIGRANELAGSGPWFVDATAAVPTPIAAEARSSGTWIRLTDDCSHGVTSSVTAPAVIGIVDRVRAKDGGDEAVLVRPLERGSSAVTTTRDGTVLTRVRFAVSGATVPPSPSGASPP